MLRLHKPFATFLVIHFEVGGNTRSLEHQKEFWQPTVDFVKLADMYDAKLTLQFNPQWAEYILKDKNKFSLLKEWQKQGHEVGLHHHGYDHGNWNGYTNRLGMENNPEFRGRIGDMMKVMQELAYPYQILSGTITDEESDYPQGIKYDTEGIEIYHARAKPKQVILGGKEVVQVGMAFLSFKGDIEKFKCEYSKSAEDEVFGIVTHEIDFAENPEIIEEWLKFMKSNGRRIQTVSEVIANYQKVYAIEYSNNPLIFLKDVVGEERISEFGSR